MHIRVKRSRSLLAMTAAILLASATMVATPASAEPGFEMKGGHPGKPSEVSRTIEIDAKEIGFGRKSFEVRDGETIRFVIRNTGQSAHDFAIGTAEDQSQRRELVEEMMDTGRMDTGRMRDGIAQAGTSEYRENRDHRKPFAVGHTEPNAVLVHRGGIRELIWTFSRVENLEFACNMPGHIAMRGRFIFVD